MNILLLTGLREELDPFLRDHPCQFSRDLRAYRSRAVPQLFAMTAGPGLSKKRELRRLLELIEPGVIVNAGLVGLLDPRDSLHAGERLRLGLVRSARSSLVFPGGPGHDVLLSVARPVFHPAEKADLADEFEARACDMEAAPLLEFASRPAAWRQRELCIAFCKVVGDRPEDYALFGAEYRIRGWQHFALWRKVWTALRFPGGPLALHRLLRYRGGALKALTEQIHATLKAILESDGKADRLDSVFRPQ